MKRFVSCLIVAALLLASLLAMIPASAATPEEFNVMGDSNKDKQFAGEGNVFYYDYHKYAKEINTFPMPSSYYGKSDYMLRMGNNDGGGTAGVCDGVKSKSDFNHSIGDIEINGITYGHAFGYSFKESVIINRVSIYLTATTPITAIDVYGASYENGVYGKEAAKTFLGSIAVDKNDITVIDDVNVVVVNVELNEAYELDYLFFALMVSDNYKVYEIEANGILASQSFANFNGNALKEQLAIYYTLNAEDWSDESWASLLSVANTAEAVNKNASATEDDVNAAATNLANAINALVKRPANKATLQGLINQASSKNEADYTPSSWTAFAKAFNDAKDVNSKSDATQNEVDDATGKLDDAMSSLVKRASKADLEAQYTRYNALVKADYTTSSWEELEAVIARTDAIRANANATENDVADATAYLENAIDSLVRCANRDAIISEIEKAETYSENDYTSGTWAILQNAIDNARELLNNADASKEDEENAISRIENAIAGLRAPATNIELLDAELEKYYALKQNDYIAESWEALELEIASAMQIKNDEKNFTNEEVAEAAERLRNAIEGLEKPANKISLTLAISAAKDLAKKDFDVTTLVWNEFQSAIEDAEAVVNNVNATQKEVDEVLAALEAKVDTLVPKSKDKEDTKPEKPEKPDKETKATETTATETKAPAKSKKGCKSTVAISALAIVATVGTALVIKKRD